jgi:hypothetical protein
MEPIQDLTGSGGPLASKSTYFGDERASWTSLALLEQGQGQVGLALVPEVGAL